MDSIRVGGKILKSIKIMALKEALGRHSWSTILIRIIVEGCSENVQFRKVSNHFGTSKNINERETILEGGVLAKDATSSSSKSSLGIVNSPEREIT